MLLGTRPLKKRIVIILLTNLIYNMNCSTSFESLEYTIPGIIEDQQQKFISRSYISLPKCEVENIKSLIYRFIDVGRHCQHNPTVESAIYHFEYFLMIKYFKPEEITEEYSKIFIDKFSNDNYRCDEYIFSGGNCNMLNYFCALNGFTSLYRPPIEHSDFIVLSQILNFYSGFRKTAIDKYFQESLFDALDFISKYNNSFRKIVKLTIQSRWIRYLSPEIFERLIHLHILKLFSFPSNAEISVILNLPSLRILVFGEMDVGEKQIATIQNCHHINFLSFCRCVSIENIKFEKMNRLICLRLIFSAVTNQTLLNIAASKSIDGLHFKCCTSLPVDDSTWAKIFNLNLKKLTIKDFPVALLSLLKILSENGTNSVYDKDYCLKQIINLKIENMNLTNDELLLILKNIHSLNILSLFGCPLIKIDKDFCDIVKKQLRGITMLNLGECGLKTIDWLLYFPFLEKLDLSKNNFEYPTREYANVSTDIKMFCNLKELFIDYCNLLLADFLIIFCAFPNLQMLSADGNHIYWTENLVELLKIETYQSSEYINNSIYNIFDNCLIYMHSPFISLLENLKNFNNLLYLSLVNCKIESCNFLAYFNENNNLKFLNVSFNRLAGSLDVKLAFIQSLSHLFLENTSVEIDFSNLINEAKNLKELNIINCKNILFTFISTRNFVLKFFGVSVSKRNLDWLTDIMKMSKDLEKLKICSESVCIRYMLELLSLNLPIHSFLKRITFYNYGLHPELTHLYLRNYIAGKIPQINFEYCLGPAAQIIGLYYLPSFIEYENFNQELYHLVYIRYFLFMTKNYKMNIISHIK